MADPQTLSTKLRQRLDRYVVETEKVSGLIGDGQGHVFLPNRTDQVFLRLDDGTLHGSAFYSGMFAIEHGTPVVAGYSIDQPDRFQILELRGQVSANAALTPPGQIASVTGLAATWQQRDCRITWAAIAPSPLFNNYLVLVDGQAYYTTATSLLYTLALNQQDHADAFDPEVVIVVVAVDVYGGQSLTPAILTATWTRPVMPNLSGGDAEWSNNDCRFTWINPVRPYTFRNFLVTIGAMTFIALTPDFVYTEAQNRADHGGVVAINITASIVAEDDGGYVSLLPLVIATANPVTVGDTVQDNFDTYGGDVIAQSGSAGLRWLKIPMGGTLMVTPPDYAYVEYLFSPPLDLTSEGRFTANDYILGHITLCAPGFTFYVVFQSAGGTATKATVETVDGSDVFLKFLRSTFVLGGSFDWTAVTGVRVAVVDRLGAYIDNPILGDVRMVKADPDDAGTFNDTGQAWDFSGGIWHIYDDVPQAPFSLGQIDSNAPPGTRTVARRVHPPYTAINHFAVGVYLMTDGAASLLALAQDADNAYEVKLNSADHTLRLLKWVNGASYALGSVAYAAAPNTPYMLGLVRDVGTNNLRVFISADGTPIFSARNLRMFISDGTYISGQIGVVSYSTYGVQTRFFQVRAGSPEHALTAEYAFDADMVDGLHAERFLRVLHNLVREHGAGTYWKVGSTMVGSRATIKGG